MIELLRTRRSIRKFQKAKITQDHLQILEEAVLRSPSSRGINPWEFVFVDNSDILDKLARCKPHGASFLKSAALGIVVCGDETKSDAWIEDCSIAALIAHMTAHSLGLASCWVQVRMRMHNEHESAEANIQHLLGLPAHLRVEAIIAIGHPAEEKTAIPKERLDFSKIRRNHL